MLSWKLFWSFPAVASATLPENDTLWKASATVSVIVTVTVTVIVIIIVIIVIINIIIISSSSSIIIIYIYIIIFIYIYIYVCIYELSFKGLEICIQYIFIIAMMSVCSNTGRQITHYTLRICKPIEDPVQLLPSNQYSESYHQVKWSHDFCWKS